VQEKRQGDKNDDRSTSYSQWYTACYIHNVLSVTNRQHLQNTWTYVLWMLFFPLWWLQMD